MAGNKDVSIRLNGFSMNLEACRQAVFDLRYPDLFQMTGIPESTLYFYHSKNVCPYISVADQIARMYCTSVGTLCERQISLFPNEKLSLLTEFLRRTGDDLTAYKKEIVSECKDRPTIFRSELYDLMVPILQKSVRKQCDGEVFVKVERRDKVVENFTRNFLNLHKTLGVNYRKMAKATGISLGNFTRFAHGVEPMLASVIRIAEYFGVKIDDLLSDEPKLDYEEIAKEIEGKISVYDTEIPVTEEELKFLRDLRTDLLTKEQYEEVIAQWLK